MIHKNEIVEIANSLGIQDSTVEKDYVLGWILMGVQSTKTINDSWIFKGGTCLKKCFFNQYRFSEDLDFSLKDNVVLDQGYLQEILLEIGNWVYENSGIEVPSKNISAEIYLNPRGKLSAQGKISYWGPLKPKQKSNLPTIKFDLTSDEKIVAAPERRNIFYPFSDKPEEIPKALTYCYEEIFAEKLRALFERARPRDLYDIIFLYQKRDLVKNKKLFLEVLRQKCAFKKIPMPNLKSIKNHPNIEILRSEWETMLKHQLPNLNAFEYYWKQLPSVFTWISRLLEQEKFKSLDIPEF